MGPGNKTQAEYQEQEGKGLASCFFYPHPSPVPKSMQAMKFAHHEVLNKQQSLKVKGGDEATEHPQGHSWEAA